MGVGDEAGVTSGRSPEGASVPSLLGGGIVIVFAGEGDGAGEEGLSQAVNPATAAIMAKGFRIFIGWGVNFRSRATGS